MRGWLSWTDKWKLWAVSSLIPSILHLSSPTSTEQISYNCGKFKECPAEFLFPVDSSFKSENPSHNTRSHETITFIIILQNDPNVRLYNVSSSDLPGKIQKMNKKWHQKLVWIRCCAWNNKLPSSVFFIISIYLLFHFDKYHSTGLALKLEWLHVLK